MKINSRLLAACLMLCIMVAAYYRGVRPQKAEIEPTQTPANEILNYVKKSETIGDNLPVSRGLAAKMIALTFNDKNYIDSLGEEINFSDVEEGMWYKKYINVVYIQGYMSGMGDQFMPLEPLTLSQAQILIDKINPDNRTKIKMTNENKEKPISYALWADLYRKAIYAVSANDDIKESYNIDEKNIIILATPANNTQLNSWCMVTENGFGYFSGYNVDSYIDKEIKVHMKDDEIISILSIENEAPTLANAYIKDVSQNAITIYTGGVERKYAYSGAEEAVGTIADVTIRNGVCLSVDFYNEEITGVLKRADEAFIELQEYGNIPLLANAKFYDETQPEVKWRQLDDLIVGTDLAKYVIQNGKICAAIMVKNPTPNRIRVALNNTDFQSLIHENIEISSTGGFSVSFGESSKTYQKDESLKVSQTDNIDLFVKPRIYIIPENGGLLEIKSITRSGLSPRYRGIIEIAQQESGFSMVNELPLEEYLYSVVPSEMPSEYGAEAAKVQAVTARSYAFNQFYANRYHAYGGNVDDSTLCQVYNNIPENEISIQAVRETEGLCIVFENTIVSTNFFSTSCGVTANAGEVWYNTATKKFPQDSPLYLRYKKFYTSPAYDNLRDEKNMYAFIKDATVTGYDSGFPWFRWQVNMTMAELTASVNENISSLFTKTPHLIKTLMPDGVYRSRPIDSIGTLTDLFVTQRGEAGNAMTLVLKGTEKQVAIETEYNIRMLLAPKKVLENGRDIAINRIDSTKVLNYSLMPSGFFVIDRIKNADGAIEFVNFFGGGNGHGVGMSQNGVKGMVDEGLTYDAILKNYYEGTEIKKML